MYHEALWPVVCFGAFFVTPLLLYRFSRISDSVLVFADSAVVALFAYLFAAQPYVPKMECLCRTGRRAGSTTSTLAEALNHDVAPPRPFMINSIRSPRVCANFHGKSTATESGINPLPRLNS
jgi:hypothetical protein